VAVVIFQVSSLFKNQGLAVDEKAHQEITKNVVEINICKGLAIC
jgi:hypothetical protein